MKYFTNTLLLLVIVSSMLTGLYTHCMESPYRETNTVQGAMTQYLNHLPRELKYSVVFSALKDTLNLFKCSKELFVGNCCTTALAFSSDGKTILSGNVLWNTETGELLQTFEGHRGGTICSAALSSDGTTAFAATDRGIAYLWNTKTGQLLQKLKGCTNLIFSAAFSPDGKTLLTASDSYGPARAFMGPNNLVNLWSVETGELLHELKGEPDAFNSVAFSPDGSTILTLGEKSCIWDARTWELLQELKGQRIVAFSPDNATIFTQSKENVACILDRKTGTCVQQFKECRKNFINAAAFSPDGSTLITASKDDIARLWDVKTGRLLQELKGPAVETRLIAFITNNNSIFMGSSDGMVRIWENFRWDAEIKKLFMNYYYSLFTRSVNKVLMLEREHREIPINSKGQTSLFKELPQEIRYSILSLYLESILSYDFSLFNVVPLRNYANSIACSPDGKTILTWSLTTACLWDVATGKLLQELQEHSGFISSAAFSPDSKTVLTGSDSGTAHLWDVVTGKLLQKLAGKTSSGFPSLVNSLNAQACIPHEKIVLSGPADSINHPYDIPLRGLLAPHHRIGLALYCSSLAPVVSTKGGYFTPKTQCSASILSVAFSPDGKIALTGFSDGTTRLWDISRGVPLRVLTGQAGTIKVITCSSNGNIILTGSNDGTACLWDIATGSLLRVLAGHKKPITLGRFSSNGKIVITGSDGDTVRLWDIETGNLLKELSGSTGSITSLACSPDGKVILTRFDDNLLRLWDIESGDLLKELLIEPTEKISSASFSADGNTIAVLCKKSVILWKRSQCFGEGINTRKKSAIKIFTDKKLGFLW